MNPVQRLRNALPKSSFAKSVALLAGGTASAQILTLLASPLLTRLYIPADFGVLAVYAAVLGILSVVASLKYELALPLAETKTAAANLLVLCLGLVACIALLTALVIGVAGSSLVGLANIPQLEPYLWLVPVGVFSVGLYQALNYWAVYARRFGIIARTKLSQSLSQNLSQLGLGFLGLTPLGLLIGQVLGQGAGVTGLGTAAWQETKEELRAVRPNSLLTYAKRYRRFPLFSSGSAFLNTAGLQLPALLLAALYGPQIAGWFALSERVVKLPLAFIGQSVAQVYLAEAANLALSDRGALQRLFRKTARQLLLVGIIPLGLVALIAPWLFRIVFGEEWATAGNYVQVLALMYLFRFVMMPLSQTLNVLERQDLQLVWDAVRVSLVCVVFFLAYFLGWSALNAILMYGIAMSLSYAVLHIMSLKVLHRT